MEIKVLASGSSGNCYRVGDGQTSLLLECGIPIKEIKKGLNFKLSEIDACLITHEHQDHCKALKDITKAGIETYMSCGTWEALGVEDNIWNSSFMIIGDKYQFRINTLGIVPFNTQHDAQEPLGYLIESRVTGEKLLFATDTYYIKYKFRGLTHIMIECNYDLRILQDNFEAGKVPQTLRNRLIESHMSLENCKKFLMANDLSKVKVIYLIHLSKGNGDPERFKREVQELTGKMVIIA